MAKVQSSISKISEVPITLKHLNEGTSTMQTNYNTLNELLQGRNKESKKLGNNTYLKRRGDNIAVLFHETDIITYHENGHISFNTGGWYSKTTKERINEFSPVYIYQDKSIWYVCTDQGTDKAESSIFYDGVTVNSKGKVIKPLHTDKNIVVRRQINAYCKALKELKALPVPNGGDCWLCMIPGSMNDKGHLISHLKEKYIHGSLIINALQSAGYNAQFVFQVDSRDNIVRAVKRYFKRELGIPR